MTGNFFVVEVLRRVEISRVEISIRVKKGIGEGKNSSCYSKTPIHSCASAVKFTLSYVECGNSQN